MALTRIETSDYTGKDIAGLLDAPSEAGMTATQLKARFDSLIKDLIALRINEIVDKLTATADPSGAKQVGFTATAKANFAELQSAIAGAYDYADAQIALAVFGEVFPNAGDIAVTDALGHFTGTDVEAVVEELYQAIQNTTFDYASVLVGAISAYLTANATASKVIVSDANGKLSASALDSAILSYLSTISSNVQTQINGKMSGTKTISASDPSGGSDGDLWFKV